jgi:hypothetical protein
VGYIRDVGQALVTVGARDAALGRAWHAPNAPAVTLREFVRFLAEEAQLMPKVSALPRAVTHALLPLLGIAVPALHGLITGAGIGAAHYLLLRRVMSRAPVWALVVAGRWAGGCPAPLDHYTASPLPEVGLRLRRRRLHLARRWLAQQVQGKPRA